MRARPREVWAAYLLMAPALALMVAVMAYPIGWEVWVSLTDLSPLNDGPATLWRIRQLERFAIEVTKTDGGEILAIFAGLGGLA